MLSPWDIKAGDSSSLFAGGSSELQPPPLKYLRSSSSGAQTRFSRSPAMPVLSSARVQETAEGNFVHAREEVDSLSDVSAVSSNRKLMIQAKIARLRIEALQEEENDVMVEMTGQLDPICHFLLQKIRTTRALRKEDIARMRKEIERNSPESHHKNAWSKKSTQFNSKT